MSDPEDLLASAATTSEGFLYLKSLLTQSAQSRRRASERDVAIPYPTTITFQTSAVPGSVFELDIDTERIIRRVVERPRNIEDDENLFVSEAIPDAEASTIGIGPTPGTPAWEEGRRRNVASFLAAATNQIQESRRLAEEANENVMRARNNGATWVEIGDALGIRPQAAHQRFAPGAKQKHAERQRGRR